MSRNIILLSLLMVLLTASMSYSQGFVKNGLVAMYTLDKADIDGKVVKDVSGNGNHATLMGNLNVVEGVIGGALEFTGVANNYVEIPKMGSWEQASVECWALQLNAASGIQGIISTWQWTAGKVHFKFESDQIQVDKNDGVKITAPRVLETWYHIIYTADTVANKLKLYVNGELASEGASGTTPQNMDERRIGSEHDGRFLNGMVDEVRIYNRILNEDEVMQNFNVESNQLAVNRAGKLSTFWSRIKTE